MLNPTKLYSPQLPLDVVCRVTPWQVLYILAYFPCYNDLQVEAPNGENTDSGRDHSFAITLTLLLLGQRFVFRQHMLSNLEAEFLDTG